MLTNPKNTTYQKTEIDKALDALLSACLLQGESGTETLFYMLQRACDELEGTIEESHDSGLCIDMTANLSNKLEEYVWENEAAMSGTSQKRDA